MTRRDKILPILTHLNRLLKGAGDIFFPPHCHHCRSLAYDCGDIHLCTKCRAELRYVASPVCTICGVPFSTADGIDHPCGRCIKATPPFAAARSALVYEGICLSLIHRFKYEHKVHLSGLLGSIAATCLKNFAQRSAADVIVPVPLHSRRLRQRCFNQAVLLGEVVSRSWGIPLARAALTRTRWTEPQIHLNAQEREENVRGAFEVVSHTSVVGKRIILVDDVCTTGSTVAECTRVLKRSGSDEVFVATVARAVS